MYPWTLDFGPPQTVNLANRKGSEGFKLGHDWLLLIDGDLSGSGLQKEMHSSETKPNSGCLWNPENF